MKNGLFINLIVFFNVLLFAFVFWLGFPGYFQEGDIYNSLAVETNHWHPVFIARFIQSLYFLFGHHSFYLFSLNIFCFYAGLCLFIVSLYIQTRSVLVLGLFSITFIGNIFFQNFIQYHSFTFPMLVWLGCAMVCFQILVPIENSLLKLIYNLLIFIVFGFALLWRHNAIISIFPLFLLFVYQFMKSTSLANTDNYKAIFLSLLIVSGGVLVVIVKFHPYVMSKNVSKTTANHIYLHQIAGAIVPENAHYLIPDDWYEKGKNFQDLKNLYSKYPLHADPLNVGWEPWVSVRPFKGEELGGLKTLWLRAIVTYPSNYLKHISRFFKAMWFQNPAWILDAQQIQKVPSHPWHVWIASRFQEGERQISLSPLREEIYKYLFKNKFLINHIIGVGAGFVLMMATGCLWIISTQYRSDMLLFSFSTSLSSTCTAILVCIFSPAPDPRYMSPVLVLSIISMIGFIAFLSSRPFIRDKFNRINVA